MIHISFAVPLYFSFEIQEDFSDWKYNMCGEQLVLLAAIHPISGKKWWGLFVSLEKLAEKVCKSRRQDFATKVR